MILLVLRYQS